MMKMKSWLVRNIDSLLTPNSIVIKWYCLDSVVRFTAFQREKWQIQYQKQKYVIQISRLHSIMTNTTSIMNDISYVNDRKSK